MQLTGLPVVVGYSALLTARRGDDHDLEVHCIYNQSIMINHSLPCSFTGSINVEEALWPKGRCTVLQI